MKYTFERDGQAVHTVYSAEVAAETVKYLDWVGSEFIMRAES